MSAAKRSSISSSLIEQGVRQRHLASGDHRLLFLFPEHRAVGLAGAAFDALADLLFEVFEVFMFGHLK